MQHVIFIMLGLMLCLMSFSCKDKSFNASVKRDTQFEESRISNNVTIDSSMLSELIKRVDTIYSDVCKTYNTSNGNGHTHQSLVDKYCSQSWQDDEKRVVAAEDKHPAEIGCLDYVFWAQGQDWDSISYSNVKVESVTSARAIVTLAVHNGEAKMVRLSLIKEHGQWMIDDFFDESTPQGIRKVMREYIKENS